MAAAGACLCVLILLLGASSPPSATAQEGSQRFVGDVCKRRDGSSGVCRNVKDCPSGLEELKQNKAPVICSFEEFTPIICCPQEGKAAKMCEEYGKAVYKLVPSPVPLPVVQYDRVNQCAVTGVPFVVGGEAAQPNEFPHMALIGFGKNARDRQWGCGGSLISNQYVMTAAHCINPSVGPAKWIRLGELDLNNDNERVNKHEDFTVSQAIPHPDWQDGVYYNDIALLKLDREVKFTASIRPACLHTIKEITEKESIASGWGRTFWAEPEISPLLMKVKIPIQQTEDCQRAYKSLSTSFNVLTKGILEESMVCAGNLTGGKDSCKGDSGGPLQVKLKNPYCMYDIIGITSFGKPICGLPDSPAVYTRVSHFIPWIESVVWP